MAEAERRIGDAGHPTAWLAVVAGNARARRFYERSGWSDRGQFDYAAASDHGPIPVPCSSVREEPRCAVTKGV